MINNGYSVAFGVNDILQATGICINPIKEELYEEIKMDYKNPINKCIFYKENNLCYYAGKCENRKAGK